MLATARVLQSVRSVRGVFERIDAEVRLHHYKIRNFTPNIEFSFERGHYLVKTVQSGAELEACLKLRFNVFHREYMNKTRTHGVDIDKLDYDCDHLMIFDMRAGRTIGTYRLNSSLFSSAFYSAGEFDINGVLALPGIKLELGRACIDREYRSGVVIALLWRGISEYIKRTETSVMFGCSSIKTMVPMEIGLITKHLIDTGGLTYDYAAAPTKKYRVKQLDRALEYLESHPFEYNKDEVQGMIPALFRSYLKMGAKMAGPPAIDRDFHCIDFLTVLRVGEMNAAVKEKYGV